MKKILLFGCVLAAVLTIQAGSASASVPIESDAQYEAQISFFKAALDEFGAVTPNQAVRLWARGDETRNGVYKYAAACDTLKQELIRRWGNPEKNFWNIGVSSPWLSSYQITDTKIVSLRALVYTVKYFWSTSAGPAEPTFEQLTVTWIGPKWCISKVEQLSSPQR